MPLQQEFLDQSGKDTWETPPEVLAPLTTHLDFDVDPCAGPRTEIGSTNWRGPAGEADGLEQDWFGTVFVNPPFSEKQAWVDKAVEEYQSGRADRLVFLTPDSTDVKSWWHGTLNDEDSGLAPHANAVWFSAGRTKFVDPEQPDDRNSPTFGTALHFLGSFPHSLYEEMSDRGDLLFREHNRVTRPYGGGG